MLRLAKRPYVFLTALLLTGCPALPQFVQPTLTPAIETILAQSDVYSPETIESEAASLDFSPISSAAELDGCWGRSMVTNVDVPTDLSVTTTTSQDVPGAAVYTFDSAVGTLDIHGFSQQVGGLLDVLVLLRGTYSVAEDGSAEFVLTHQGVNDPFTGEMVIAALADDGYEPMIANVTIEQAGDLIRMHSDNEGTEDFYLKRVDCGQ